jgi:hypothetical protein
MLLPFLSIRLEFTAREKCKISIDLFRPLSKRRENSKLRFLSGLKVGLTLN